MSEQDRVAQIITSTGGDGTAWTAGSISIGADSLWQVAPRNLGADGYSVAYFIETVIMTVTDDGAAFGTGSTRRMAGYRWAKGGTLTMTTQSPVEYYGGQVYPEFSAAGANIAITYNLTNIGGYYFHCRAFHRIIAHEPLGQNFSYP